VRKAHKGLPAHFSTNAGKFMTRVSWDRNYWEHSLNTINITEPKQIAGFNEAGTVLDLAQSRSECK